MSLEKIINNQELINKYNVFKTTLSIYKELDEKQKKEVGIFKKNLKKSILELKSNPYFEKVATETEQGEINEILQDLNE